MPPKRRKPLEESSSASSGNAAGSGGPSILEELSAEEKKRIRSQYRKLHQEVLDRQREGPTRGDEDEDTFTRLTNYLGDMNVIFEKVKCPEEAYLDSALFRTVNAQYMDETKKLALVQNNHFDLDEFALKMGGGCVGLSHKSRNLAQKWVNFGRKMTRHFHPAPAVEYLYGAVDTDEVVLKTVAAPRRAAKKTYGREQVTKISTKDVPAKSEEEKAEFQIKAVLKSLKDELRRSNRTKLDFFEFALDPGSFSQSVENIFWISFLVKDRRVVLDEANEDGLLEIYPNVSAGGGGGANGAGDEPAQQILISLTKNQWRQFVGALELKKPLIKYPKVSGDNDEPKSKGKKSRRE